MSAHVLLNLFNSWEKEISLFRIEFNKFNNTEARMLDSIFHMALKLPNGIQCSFIYNLL